MLNFRALIAELEECVDDIEKSCSAHTVDATIYAAGSAISGVKHVIAQLRKAAPACPTCGECHDLWREGTIHYYQEPDGGWVEAEARVKGMQVYEYGPTVDEARERVICLTIRAVRTRPGRKRINETQGHT